MARYQRDFGGIRADTQSTRGMDPNYQGGYGGMRLRGGPYQAPYGLYRYHHTGELGGGGREGYRPGGRYDRGLTYPRRRPEAYDREVRGGGGVFDWREHPETMRQYNVNSPLLRGGGGREEPGPGRLERGGRSREFDHRYRGEYGNRGLSSSGFSEPWARGPMRGAR